MEKKPSEAAQEGQRESECEGQTHVLVRHAQRLREHSVGHPGAPGLRLNRDCPRVRPSIQNVHLRRLELRLGRVHPDLPVDHAHAHGAWRGEDVWGLGV